MELEGKTAVVTGASSGFGAATVRKLREAGARVVGGARRVERIDADLALPLDVTDEESCAAFVTRAATELGGIDVLYNNAGLALGRYPFTESNPEDEATVLHTNVDGAIRITRLALPHVRDGGHILFTGSIAGRQAYENAAVYVAAKFALRGFVYGLREDLLGRPIRITTVDPGLAQTEFSLVRFKGDEEAAKAPYEGVEPLTADDVAECVLFAITRPLHVNIDEMVIKALAQSSGGRIVRNAQLMLTILEGSTFCICDDRGDIAAETSGFFAHDTRFLSRLVLRVDGTAPLLLSSGRVEHFQAGFYLRNGTANGLPRDSISIARERFVSTGMQERVTLRNESPERLEIEVALEAEADFADIISVKLHDFSLGDPELAQPLPPPAPTTYDEGRSQVSIVDPRGDLGTRLVFSKPGRLDGNAMTYSLALDPHESWHLSVDVLPWLENDLETIEQLDEERETVGDVVAAWTLRVPRVRGGWESLRRAFDRSIADLAALRMRTGEYRRPLFAAGMPWFMTVFGRDTAITSLQTLLLGPEIAIGAIEALTDLQAQVEDPTIDAEPGKIVHEVREGRCAETWFPRYYGSIDSTPLYLVLLAETWRWTDDASFAQRMREPALLALEWIDRYGDRDGDGFVEYSRLVDSGLANQSWKDSGDSQRFQDGTFAEAPIAAVEVQGYVYDAKRGLADLAREVWRDKALADRLDREADELRTRFDEAFWLDERGGFYALALDGQKRPVDSRSSNMGHLLWSGIVPPEKVGRVVDQLLSEDLWTGWGIRTMASDAAAFNPISYHNGTVWPHDTSLAAWGLARHGYHGRGAAHRASADRGGSALRLVAARGLRRVRAHRDAVPDRLSDGRPARRPGRQVRRSCSCGSSSASSRIASGSGSSRP